MCPSAGISRSTWPLVARSSMLLLVLSGREFEELIQRAIPSVSRRMLMVLGQRLREADERVARITGERPGSPASEARRRVRD